MTPFIATRRLPPIAAFRAAVEPTDIVFLHNIADQPDFPATPNVRKWPFNDITRRPKDGGFLT